MDRFEIQSSYRPQGDQPQAIEQLVQGLQHGYSAQTLLGVTGSGKTFTMANVIERVQRPALVLAHNKTLAAQLCGEFKEIFPNNAVEYFVSYYDYYQPEAYIPSSDTYIEKDSQRNDEIDKLRHSATSSLLERRDVIIVASVSCIFALGSPKEYYDMSVSLRPGMTFDRDDMLRQLVGIQYERNDVNFIRGTFRVRGDVVEVFPADQNERCIRVEFFGDEIERITQVNALTGEIIGRLSHALLFPATHYVTSREKMDQAMVEIEQDMLKQVDRFKENEQLIEAQRLAQRTQYDLEMMQEIGYCNGIENYSRYFDGRKPGEAPFTLLDYFPEDFIFFIDESHVTIPQVRAMYGGDFSRKNMLVQYGFRLPSAFDNRPLRFEEFEARIGQTIFVSATPGQYEAAHSKQTVEQIIRPTGLIDPEVILRPVAGQVDDLLGEIRAVAGQGMRVLVTTLTKRMAEDLTAYYEKMNVRVRYLHSEIQTLERSEILRDLRLGKFDVLIGINLLREGLDLPEVALVAILDADKEGFLRSETSLIQTIGRAARNVEGRVIMYADHVTDSMRHAIDETSRRRTKQTAFNHAHNITPRSIQKAVHQLLEITQAAETPLDNLEPIAADIPLYDRIETLRGQMMQAAQQLEFERAAQLRDAIVALQSIVDKEHSHDA